jgi:transposase
VLGPPKPRRLDAPIAVSLADLVPHGNVYRHLEATLDRSFVRDWTRKLYAGRGRPSIDPVVFLTLQLVMVFEGIRSERTLIATARLNLAPRYSLGDALDEELSDHSSLTRIRQRLGIAMVQRFFEQVVDLCQDARLVWGQELFCDATKGAANADRDALVPRFSHEATSHVADLFTADPVPTDGHAGDSADPLPCDGLLHLPVWETQRGTGRTGAGTALEAAGGATAGLAPARDRHLPTHERLARQSHRSQCHTHAH